MKLIVAVYDDWGIGTEGTQPIALTADRKFFRETTKGGTVIVGRRTVEDFPGKKPLPGRQNYLLTRKGGDYPGFILCASPAEAAAQAGENAFIIGGGSVYRQMLTYCDTAYVTKIHAAPVSDTFFPNLDQEPGWTLWEILRSGEENGIRYEICLYRRK